MPRALLFLARYRRTPQKNQQILPRHLLLVLVLAAHKFQEKPIRRYWEELAKDIGVRPGTVRKWAYELRRAGLLRIKQNRGRDRAKDSPGFRNERNTFVIDQFVDMVAQAFEHRQSVKAEKGRTPRGGGS